MTLFLAGLACGVVVTLVMIVGLVWLASSSTTVTYYDTRERPL